MPYKLTPQQREAAYWIAMGELPKDIENGFKIKPNTLVRWRRIPAFMDAIEQYVRDMEEASRYRLRTARYYSTHRLYKGTQYWSSISHLEMPQMMTLVRFADNLLGSAPDSGKTPPKSGENPQNPAKPRENPR